MRNTIDEDVMRLDNVILNDKKSLGKKSKVALRIADPEGKINERNKITGIVYRSQNPNIAEKITFERYNLLGKPEYILRMEDGSLLKLPEELYPVDFEPKKFD